MIQIDVHSEAGSIFALVDRAKSLGKILGKSEDAILYIQGKMHRSCSYEESMTHFIRFFEGEVELINGGPK